MKKAVALLLALLLALALCACGAESRGGAASDKTAASKDETPSAPWQEAVNIVPAEQSTLSYESFDNGLISMQIPEGWRVDVMPTGYTYYAFRAYDLQCSSRQIIGALKFEGAVKSQAARDWFAYYYGADNIFAKTAILEDNTAECFFKAFNDVCALNNNDSFAYPYMYGFTVIENFGSTVFGGDLLRASYYDGNGLPVEGIFTATVMDLGPYMVSSNIMDIYSAQIDAGVKNVYSVFFYTSPAADFIQWQSVLDYCLSTLAYSDAFMSGYSQEQNQIMETFNSVRSSGSEISDMINSAWERRNSSYDITTQKQSDATLGYERVYDTQTNEIYRAYNGFTDSYDGDRYQSVTEDMYTHPIAGYIEP